MFLSKKFSLIIVVQALALGIVLAIAASSGWIRPASAASDLEQTAGRIWYDIDETSIESNGIRRLVPDAYRTLTADYDALVARLKQAPMEFTPESYNINTVMILPLPNGIDERFRIFESPVMAPGLAKKFPEIKTYTAIGIDDPHASGRLDLTPAGFHAMIFTAEDTFYIDPFSTDSDRTYISYFKRDYSAPEDMVYNELGPLGEPEHMDPGDELRVGENLRTHRLAQATTGEYSIFHGGTVPSVMAEVVTAINRVTGIYEREVAVRLELIANNDLLIFLDPDTDPYTNSSGGTMLGQNQATIDSVIGNANYDIGHVFSTGGGGIASLRAVCNTGQKARGVTGLSQPVNDPFYVDYVAHEMGHQYGGNHTFNGTDGSCGGNRYGPAAYEPGSGTTIMAYAGICSSHNTQSNSDDYFHTKSFDEMIAFTTTGDGADCGTVTSTGNNPPVVDAGDGGFTIPIETPFTLAGSATDPDSDLMTYNWEEFDLGPAGDPNSPADNAPIFRSFLANPVPVRVFPQISDILNNKHTIGEILPTYSRSLTFRLTARDNHAYPSAGGVSYDTVAFSATDQAGPFEVVSPNTAVNWAIGSLENVTWDVANTNASPVNCSLVDILLSPDGGYTYSSTIITGTLNDGSENVLVPNVPTSAARLMVKCTNNIFFDVSDTNFSILDLEPFSRLEALKSVEMEGEVLSGEMLTYTIDIVNSGNSTATTTITDTFDSALVDPVCNGIPGNVSDQIEIPSATITTYTCNAQVDPTLNIQIEKTVDQEVISQGTAVTYTIVITNPNTSTSIDDVVVSDPNVGACTPNLSTPITLDSMTSQIYFCPGVIPSSDMTNTAEVSGIVSIENMASASAPEDVDSPVSSDTVVNHVYLNANDSASVMVEFASLSLVKSVNPEADLETGDLITYTIAISNSGNITASMTITDTFDPALINPTCNGDLGDLADQQDLSVGASLVYLCAAQVDPSLAVEISKTVDNPEPNSGTSITFTIVVTNPNTLATLENIVVTDHDVGSCSPNLSTPIQLSPLTSQVYVCPNIVPVEDMTNTASVLADVVIRNVASASAPEDSSSPVYSNSVENYVLLSDSDSASVTIRYHLVFIPLLEKAAEAPLMPRATASTLGYSVTIVGIGLGVTLRRRRD